MDKDLYFEQSFAWNQKFWSRFGLDHCNLSGMSCLDLGCGVGSLTIDLALRGAHEVVAIDPDADRISYAKKVLTEKLNPDQMTKVTLRACTSAELSREHTFDLIVSRDTFEHIHDLEGTLKDMYDLTKPGGAVLVGFGPMYKGPFGDHGLLCFKVPWLHNCVVAENGRLTRLGVLYKRYLPTKMRTAQSALNFRKYSSIEQAIRGSGFQVEWMSVNVSSNWVVRMFSLLRKISPLREYFTVNAYFRLKRPDGD